MSGQNRLTIEFIGCGDAFGSGGRFNTCFHVTGDEVNFLIDCGASSLIALKRRQIDLNTIETILVTHFHADHFAGLPFFMLDAQFLSKRSRALTIAGPAGTEKRYRSLSEAMFPGSSATVARFPLRFVELKSGANQELGRLNVEAFEVNHGHEGGPFHGYRIKVLGRTIAYTGDTEWTDSLMALGREADLLIAEAYFHEKKVRLHLDYVTLSVNLGQMNPRRVVVTHMSADMLDRDIPPPIQLAHDGLQIRV